MLNFRFGKEVCNLYFKDLVIRFFVNEFIFGEEIGNKLELG